MELMFNFKDGELTTITIVMMIDQFQTSRTESIIGEGFTLKSRDQLAYLGMDSYCVI